MKLLAIYLVTSNDTQRTKVGISSNPFARLATMQTGSSEKLHLVWTSDLMDAESARRIEKQVHAELSPWHVHGEWFERACHLCADAIDTAMASRVLQ